MSDALTSLTSLPEWMKDMPPWALLALTFLWGGAFNKTLDWLTGLARLFVGKGRPNPDRPIDVIEDVHETYTLMNELLTLTDAKRVLMLRAENGGNIPVIGKELTATVVYEVFGERSVSIRDTWQRQQLDDEYVRTLRALSSTGSMEICTKDMREGILRDSHRRHGVAIAHLWDVYSTEGAYYYLAIQFEQGHSPDMDDAQYRDSVRSAITRVATLFDKWHRGRSRQPR